MYLTFRKSMDKTLIMSEWQMNVVSLVGKIHVFPGGKRRKGPPPISSTKLFGELVLLGPTSLGSISLEVLISKGDELALRGLVRILLKIEH